MAEDAELPAIDRPDGPSIMRSTWMAGLAGLVSAVAFWLALPGNGSYVLSYVCLVPVLYFAVRSAWGPAFLGIYIFVFMTYFFGCSWLLDTRRHGSMSYMLIFTSLIHSIYPFLAFSGARKIYDRFHLPLTVVVPLSCVTSEYLANILPSLTSGFFLGQTNYRSLYVIQISDLFGIYGVSYVVGMVNGMLLDLFVLPGEERARRPRLAGVVIGGVTLLLVVSYGILRLGQVERESTKGPSVLVARTVYGDRNVLQYVFKALPFSASVIVLPEAISSVPLNDQFRMTSLNNRLSNLHHDLFKRISREYRTILIVNTVSVSGADRWSTSFIYCSNGKVYHYNKISLVPFIEYLPLRGWGGEILNDTIGWKHTDDYFFTKGKTIEMFTADLRGYDGFNFVTSICADDSSADLMREMVYQKDKKADAVFMSVNDGVIDNRSLWYQHLSLAVFRAVENRVAVARANTTIASIIAPSGRITHMSDIQTLTPEFLKADLELYSGISKYGKWKDWFAGSCLVVWGILFLCPKTVCVKRLDRSKPARDPAVPSD